jgi:hypothetical protein
MRRPQLFRAVVTAIGLSILTAGSYLIIRYVIAPCIEQSQANDIRQTTVTLLATMIPVLVTVWAICVALDQANTSVLDRRKTLLAATITGGLLLWATLATVAVSLIKATTPEGTSLSISVLIVVALMIVSIVCIVLRALS